MLQHHAVHRELFATPPFTEAVRLAPSAGARVRTGRIWPLNTTLTVRFDETEVSP